MGNKSPSNWSISNIGYICSVGSSKRIYKSEYVTDGIPFYRSKEIIEKSKGVNPKIELFIPFEKYQTLKQKYGNPKEGDILLTAVGTIGISYVIKDEGEFYFKDGNLIWFKDILKEIDSNYLKLWLDSESGQKKLQEGSIGSNQRALTIRGVKEVQFPLPPLAEQQRIVAKLDELFGHLDSLKSRLKNIPQIIKNFRQAVLTQAVTGKLTEEWRVGKEFDWIELDNYCESSFYGPRFSKEDYTETGFPTVRTTDMTDNGFLSVKTNTPRINITDKKKIELYKVKDGDLLITRTGSIGKMARYKGNQIVIPSAYLIRFRFKKNVITDFVYYCLTSPYGQKIMGLNSTALTQPNLNAKKIRSIRIPDISLEKQTEIVKRVELLFAKADKIETQYQNLKTKIDSLPQAILAKAFKGELVAQLDTDGDAKVLLEEIQKLRESLVKKPVKKRKK